MKIYYVVMIFTDGYRINFDRFAIKNKKIKKQNIKSFIDKCNEICYNRNDCFDSAIISWQEIKE